MIIDWQQILNSGKAKQEKELADFKNKTMEAWRNEFSAEIDQRLNEIVAVKLKQSKAETEYYRTWCRILASAVVRGSDKVRTFEEWPKLIKVLDNDTN